jgi:alpha-methylacyl-CoA racemase
VFAGSDACVTPVLAFGEVAQHPQLAARATIVEANGVPQAAPAPRFSRTAPELPAPPRPPEPVDGVLADWPPR